MIQDWGEFYIILGKANGISFTRYKLWSFVVLFQKQIMNARRESKERNLTWRIQENNNCWTHLEHFLESISCILYVILKLRKSEIQRFKQCVNRSWNKEVIAIGSQSHQVEGQFRSCEISLWLRNRDLQLAKFRSPSCMPVKSSWVLPDICNRLF